MVFIWKLLINPLGGYLGIDALQIYELLPAFILSGIAIVVVSLLTEKPSAKIEADFEAVKNGEVEDSFVVENTENAESETTDAEAFVEETEGSAESDSEIAE